MRASTSSQELPASGSRSHAASRASSSAFSSTVSGSSSSKPTVSVKFGEFDADFLSFVGRELTQLFQNLCLGHKRMIRDRKTAEQLN